jgi:hypothetical protein
MEGEQVGSSDKLPDRAVGPPGKEAIMFRKLFTVLFGLTLFLTAASAQAGIRIGVGIGLPVEGYYAPHFLYPFQRPVHAAPTPVYLAPPADFAPSPYDAPALAMPETSTPSAYPSTAAPTSPLSSAIPVTSR